MSEKIEKLVRMANQIADFFQPYPAEKAAAGVEEHIRSFWTKRMREELAAHAAAGGERLKPAVMRAMAGPIKAESPTEKAVEGPQVLGQMASDAG